MWRYIGHQYQYTTPSRGYRLPIILQDGSKMVGFTEEKLLDSNIWDSLNLYFNFDPDETHVKSQKSLYMIHNNRIEAGVGIIGCWMKQLCTRID